MTPASPRAVPAHLSQEAFDDLLIGLGSTQAHAHLAGCTQCSQRFDRFRQDVNLFNEASLAWAEARLPRGVRPPRRARFFVPSPVLSLCAAAMLLVAIGLPAVLPHHPTVPDAGLAARSESSDQIAQDNQLMKDVDAAINPDEASLVSQYDLLGNHSSGSRRAAGPRK